MMDFNEYSKAAKRTIKENMKDSEMFTEGCLGASGEAGELLEHLKKHMFHGHPLDYVYIEKEIGDVLWYLNEIALSISSDLETIAMTNIDKLSKRYPEGFSTEKSINRKE
jgi:NTP pyrophosphatase (non-canonical NTP hydrolase)